MKITLSAPVPYRDSQLDFIDLDLDSLTGRDLIAIEDNARALNQNVVLFSQSYFAAIAAKAAHLPMDLIRSLPVKDFMKITNQVMLFLSDTVSETSTATTSEA